ncbi:type I-E CRISPR-associated protein Cse2/CasB [Bifidobacterium callitrichos]|nr:type I-E CRISPR-associated protein Cse2/CasB [Bifidobacterium callitrichos]
MHHRGLRPRRQGHARMARRRPRTRKELTMGVYTDYREWASRRLWKLQDAYLNDTYTRGPLAILARSITKEPGTDPKAAKWSIKGMPDTTSRPDNYHTPLEQGSWNAFALYAIHQRTAGHTQGMYTRGVTVEQALARLEQADPDSRRRIRKLTNTRTMKEAVTILKELIRTMGDHHITLDHTILAIDLARLENPNLRQRVLGRWANHRPDTTDD